MSWYADSSAILKLLIEEKESAALADFIDFTNFSIVYWLTPYTSPGGSGTFLDSIVAGPGSSGGSAIRYWTYIAYALMAGIGYATVKTCWGVLNEKKSRND